MVYKVDQKIAKTSHLQRVRRTSLSNLVNLYLVSRMTRISAVWGVSECGVNRHYAMHKGLFTERHRLEIIGPKDFLFYSDQTWLLKISFFPLAAHIIIGKLCLSIPYTARERMKIITTLTFYFSLSFCIGEGFILGWEGYLILYQCTNFLSSWFPSRLFILPLFFSW